MSMPIIGSVLDIASGNAKTIYMLNCRQVFNKWDPKLPRRYQEYVLWDVTSCIFTYDTDVSEDSAAAATVTLLVLDAENGGSRSL
jgi:hypothetical protein